MECPPRFMTLRMTVGIQVLFLWFQKWMEACRCRALEKWINYTFGNFEDLLKRVFFPPPLSTEDGPSGLLRARGALYY